MPQRRGWINDRDFGSWLHALQIWLNVRMKIKGFCNGLHPAVVRNAGIEFGEPWEKALRNAVVNPELDFLTALDGILP
ncbi:hypothetical protein ABTC76_20730, partial [Acinetobacter baumannii]